MAREREEAFIDALDQALVSAVPDMNMSVGEGGERCRGDRGDRHHQHIIYRGFKGYLPTDPTCVSQCVQLASEYIEQSSPYTGNMQKLACIINCDLCMQIAAKS